MTIRNLKTDDPLDDFAAREVTLDGVAKRVYLAGSGPAVIARPESFGLCHGVYGCGRSRIQALEFQDA